MQSQSSSQWQTSSPRSLSVQPPEASCCWTTSSRSSGTDEQKPRRDHRHRTLMSSTPAVDFHTASWPHCPADCRYWNELTTPLNCDHHSTDVLHAFRHPVTMNSFVWLNRLVVSALGIRSRWPWFDSRVVPLFHLVATLGKLFTHIVILILYMLNYYICLPTPQFLSSKKMGYKKGSFRRPSGYGD